jgi:hypothetical protein
MKVSLLYVVFNKYINHLDTSALFHNSQYKMFYVLLLIVI